MDENHQINLTADTVLEEDSRRSLPHPEPLWAARREVPVVQEEKKRKGDTAHRGDAPLPEEKKMVEDFAKTIDITNTSMVLQCRAGAQRKSPPSPSLPCKTSAPRTWARWGYDYRPGHRAQEL